MEGKFLPVGFVLLRKMVKLEALNETTHREEENKFRSIISSLSETERNQRKDWLITAENHKLRDYRRQFQYGKWPYLWEHQYLWTLTFWSITLKKKNHSLFMLSDTSRSDSSATVKKMFCPLAGRNFTYIDELQLPLPLHHNQKWWFR